MERDWPLGRRSRATPAKGPHATTRRPDQASLGGNRTAGTCSLGTFSDTTFLITTSGSVILLVLSTVLGIFQTVMKTVTLDVRQWLICTAVALSIVAAAEIRKAVRRRTAAT